MGRKIKLKSETDRERGISLAETLVALGILSTVAVIFLGGMLGSTKAVAVSDEKTTAQSIAQSAMEYVQNASYATEYIPGNLIQGGEFTVNVTVTPLNTPDNGIQKISVDVFKEDRQAYYLEGYKSNR